MKGSEFEREAREARDQENHLIDTARRFHEDGWRKTLSQAKGGGPAKYGIYGSRILAVPHPEVYLQADALFWQIATTVPGFKDAYGISDAADMYNMQWSRAIEEGLSLSRPLIWDDIPSDEYSVVRSRSAYPARYPFLPFLDRRMLPLAVSLKVWRNHVLPPEMAEHYYFRAKSQGADPAELFIVVCDDDTAYLARDGELLSMATRRPTEAPTGRPVLVFNESVVWFPLMGRDDRGQSPALASLVARCAAEPGLPELTEQERAFADALKSAGALKDHRQVDMAMLAALRANGIDHDPYIQVWERSVIEPEVDHPWLCDRKLGIIRECDRYANYFSPIAAYLAALVTTAKSQETGIRVMAGEYLKYAGVVRDDERGAGNWKRPGRLEAWGHVWYCPLMEYTIDDAYRAAGGHCVSQSMSLSAVLELAGVDHYVTHFNRGGVGTTSHHFVSSADGKFVLDDAIVNYFETGAWKTDDWGCLLSFSKDGEWASLVVDEYFGNIPPEKALAHVERIQSLIGGRFGLNFLSITAAEQVQPKENWLRYMATVKDWKPVTTP